jgi:hypothetical protein
VYGAGEVQRMSRGGMFIHCVIALINCVLLGISLVKASRLSRLSRVSRVCSLWDRK